MVVGHQRHTGVFPEQIELAAFLCATGQVTAQTTGDPGVVTLGAQVLSGQFSQQCLLCEHAGADADDRFFSRLADQRQQQGKAQ